MRIVEKKLSKPEQCGYLSDRNWQLEYHFVSELTKREYTRLVESGWRKYGKALFRPRCPSCSECRPIRLIASQFEFNRSQKRTIKKNQDILIKVESSKMDDEIIRLYYRHHQSRADEVGWPEPEPGQSLFHLWSLSDNPFPIERWCHYLDDELVAVCYVDPLSDGYSLVYSFYDPDYKSRSLGTWMILSVIEKAREVNLPHVYLGYYVKDCRSMNYKIKFAPNQIMNEEGLWIDSDTDTISNSELASDSADLEPGSGPDLDLA